MYMNTYTIQYISTSRRIIGEYSIVEHENYERPAGKAEDGQRRKLIGGSDSRKGGSDPMVQYTSTVRSPGTVFLLKCFYLSVSQYRLAKTDMSLTSVFDA